TIGNIKPNQGGSSTWGLTNTGSLDGILSIEITNVVNKENGMNEPETLVDTTGGEFEGELGAHLNIKIKITDSDKTTKTWPIAGDRWAKVNDVAGKIYAVSGIPGTLKAGEKESIWFAWNLHKDTGNIIQ
ncbi:unnamed protein product, partial [marine sediment metagenome]